MPEPPIFVTGGTGYIGRPFIEAVLERGYAVHALVRSGSERRLPQGAMPFVGDALDASTFEGAVPRGATFVHLVGTPHPNPAKAAEFTRVDLASIRAATRAAERVAARHFVYVSVAQPAPVMKAFIAVRQEGEAMLAASGIPTTIVRPWYVLGPGHYWPYLLVPAYAALRLIPATRDGVERLGLVTRPQMIAALVGAIENPPSAGVRIVDVPKIRQARL